jgi:NAD(P)H dehydrogenase (quinone)
MCLTTGGTRERFSASGVYGDIRTVLWPAQRLMIEYLGMEALDPFVAYGVARVDNEVREAYLEEWRRHLLDVAEGTVAGG